MTCPGVESGLPGRKTSGQAKHTLTDVVHTMALSWEITAVGQSAAVDACMHGAGDLTGIFCSSETLEMSNSRPQWNIQSLLLKLYLLMLTDFLPALNSEGAATDGGDN